jgi:predicted 2-oxoglutarate/Fe(II)-dependent dioxygenase YbiX
MPRVDHFHALGLFVRNAFLVPEECRDFTTHMLADAGVQAEVFGDVATGAVATDIRRAWELELPSNLVSLLNERLHALRPALESHFGKSLGDADAPSPVRYPEGAFYRAHRDRRETPDSSHAERRAVSVVIFVNGPHDVPGFGGGLLRFYGLVGEGALADVGIDAEPRAGTLIAFPSTLQHEVTTVEHGTRLTIVTWFPDRPEFSSGLRSAF